MPVEITPDQAFVYANLFLTFVQRSISVVPSELEDLFIGEVVNDPIKIFDLNESDLFYDYPVALNEDRLGTVRVAATKLLGNPWIAIQQALPFNTSKSLEQATVLLAQELPESTVIDSKPVCYIYPTVGLLLRIRLADGEQAIRIFDPDNTQHQLIEISEGFMPDSDSIEGEIPFSLLQSLPEAGYPEVDYDEFDQLLNGMISEFQNGQPEIPKIPKERLESYQLKQAMIWNCQNRAEGFPEDQPEGQTKEKILPVKLIHQDDPFFCVIACMKMIADFLEISLPSQSDIALALQNPPSIFTTGQGIRPSDQTSAFQRTFPNNVQIQFDGSPNWQKFVEEINAERPFKSGVTSHARVAIGYQEIQIGSVGGSDIQLQRSLWLNDPSKSAGIMLEPHELAKLDPTDFNHIISVKPRIPFKNNSVLVQKL
jgi:hypothetical protein